MFSNLWIERAGLIPWFLRLPDLTPYENPMWEYINAYMYCEQRKTIGVLKFKIIPVTKTIHEIIVKKVHKNMVIL